jgi:FixJ family two-component response regulator
MDLKLKKKTLKGLIKNTYKKNKFIRDILAVLCEQEGYKVYCWPKQIEKLLHYNKSECLIIDSLIYYRN